MAVYSTLREFQQDTKGVQAKPSRHRLASAFRAAQADIAASGVPWNSNAAETLVAKTRRGRAR